MKADLAVSTDTELTVAWLVAGDPSVRWQAERDLLDKPEEIWRRTRQRIGAEGWGHDLLAHQDATGTWGGGLYQPKWTSTTYTLLLLRRLGLDHDNPMARRGAEHLLDDADWCDGGVSYWSGRKLAERCVNGMVLALGSYFRLADSRLDSIAGLLTAVAMADGGWNCRDQDHATHSSFHTTISVLEGLLEWKRATGSAAADAAIRGGQEFLLAHQMYKSHRTGEVINEAWTKAWFPPRWHYDVLRGLDHLRDSGQVPDSRAADAVDLIRAAQRADGRWPKGSQYSGEVYLTLEPGRVAGRWNTLRALRVLRWYDDA